MQTNNITCPSKNNNIRAFENKWSVLLLISYTPFPKNCWTWPEFYTLSPTQIYLLAPETALRMFIGHWQCTCAWHLSQPWKTRISTEICAKTTLHISPPFSTVSHNNNHVRSNSNQKHFGNPLHSCCSRRLTVPAKVSVEMSSKASRFSTFVRTYSM